MTSINRQSKISYSFLLLLFSFSLLFASCSINNSENDQTEPTLTIEVAPTTTPSPQPTSTPEPETIAVVTSSELKQDVVDNIKMSVEEVAQSNALVVQYFDNSESLISVPNLKIAVLLTMPNDLDGLLNNLPNTNFIVYSEWDIQSRNNLNIIRIHPEYRTFMAGYLIELIATDRRAAAILPNDTVFGTALEDSLKNGGHYYCGICQTYYAPYVSFPLATSLPTTTDLTTWLSYVDEMLKNYVYVMYVSPKISSPDLYYELARRGLILAGGETPPDEILPYWAATIDHDLISPLDEILPNIISGQTGIILDAPLTLSDINVDLFSIGKQNLYKETYDILQEGLIYPYNPF